MASRPLSRQFKKAGDTLLKGISSQVTDYSSRFQTLGELHSRLIVNLIRTDFNLKEAAAAASRFFGSERVAFAAVDGTEYTNRMFDLVVFFGGSYSAKGFVDFSRDPPHIEYSTRLMEGGVGVSSCVPMYVNQIVEVEQTYLELGEDGNITTERPMTDEAVVNNSTIANWIMTFSEFYLAYKLATSQKPPQIARARVSETRLS